MSQPSRAADTLVRERTETLSEEGDADRFSHYVPRARLTEALVMGTPVVALCGKIWVPTHNPERYPVCPTCKEIWESLRPGPDRDPDR
ncbi:MAG: DUF3039 domain-containing protein [Actinomycetia bacterium]|nr:DUF3039 domain-containing protein [Actinomycetes bacterium]